MNYKKSILSLVTIMALSGTALADDSARYVRLTSDTNDASWTLFGVNGFSSGKASSHSSAAGSFSSGYIMVEDSEVNDNLAVSGLTSGGGDLLSVQAIDDDTLTSVQVAAKILQPYEATEPVRSMYIVVKSRKDYPVIKVNYKASMEGQKLQIQLDKDGNILEVTINEDNTYSNPAIAKAVTQTADEGLSNIVDVLDYNFRENPLNPRYYSKKDNLNEEDELPDSTKTAKSAIFYHYDSPSATWRVWNRKLTGNANDFTKFSKGDAYWGQVDTNDANPVNDEADTNVTISGLILGTSGESAANAAVYQNKLEAGWNMIAIDPIQQYIRHAATGLVATMDPAKDGNITITDSSTIHSVKVSLIGGTNSDRARKINVAIESAKLKGELPSYVNIKAFSSSATEIAFISDAKFTITDNADQDNITTVKTLTGDEPFNGVGQNGANNGDAITDLNESSTDKYQQSATSAYGEYGFIIDLLTGDLATNGSTTTVRVAGDLDSNCTVAGSKVSAMIKIGDLDGTSAYSKTIKLTGVADGLPNAGTAKTEIEKHPLFATTPPADAYGKAIPIDTDGNGANDKMIIASKYPFYIQDYTFTRVFKEDNASVVSGTNINIIGKNASDASVTKNITIDVNKTKAFIAKQINELGEETSVYADFNGTNLVAVSTELSTFDIKDYAAATGKLLTNTTAAADKSALAQGAVAGVYAIDSVAQLSVEPHKVGFKGWVLGVNADTAVENNVTVWLNGVSTLEANLTNISDVNISDDDNVSAFFNAIVTKINTKLLDYNLSAYAYHDYETDTGSNTADILLTKGVYIEGYDINSSTYVVMDTNDSTDFTRLLSADYNTSNDNATDSDDSTPAVAAALSLGNDWSALVADLKTNAIYTPNYADFGPLYTFKDADGGYDVRSILKATTRFSDSKIKWDGIDLTRDEADWYKNNEFNLFNVNNEAGYWVYLTPKTTSSIQITNAKYTPTYTYYFDNKSSDGEYPTTNIINGGQFSVDIAGIDNEVSTAYVTVAGENVELKSSTGNTYTADFYTYSLKSFAQQGSDNLSFTVRVTNGKGTAVKESDIVSFDYTPPVLKDQEVVSAAELTFATATEKKVTFHVFNEFIPELDADRESTDVNVSRIVGEFATTTGSKTTNLCNTLDFGFSNALRVVAADGDGKIGSSNLSDAINFKYAITLKGAKVLTHAEDSTDEKAILGLNYGSDCVAESNVTDTNSGVSLKTLASNQTARLSFVPVEGVTSSLSSSWTAQYSVDDTAVIQVQNLEEYKNHLFFVEYKGKMYRSAFPESQAAADASADTPIKLDDTTAFKIDSNYERDITGGTGEQLSIINNDLAPVN